MSEFSDILTSEIQLKRLTDDLLDKSAVLGSMNSSRQPSKTSRLKVIIDGATVSNGLVNVAGSTNESFAFSQNDIKIGEKDFISISGITTSGISDGFIEIKAVSVIGQPINQEVEVYSSLKVRFYPIDGKIRMMAMGQEKIAKYKFMCESDKVVKENDLIYALSGIQGLTRGQVSFVEQILDFAGLTHHLENEVIPL